MKLTQRLLSSLLLAYILSSSVIAVEAGSPQTTPVTATIEATKLSVTVPANIPVTINNDGTITVSDDVKIINNSCASIDIKSVTVTAKDDWGLYSFSDKEGISKLPVDSKKLGLQMKLGSHSTIETDETNTTDTFNPVDWSVDRNSDLDLDYDAISGSSKETLNSIPKFDVVFTVCFTGTTDILTAESN